MHTSHLPLTRALLTLTGGFVALLLCLPPTVPANADDAAKTVEAPAPGKPPEFGGADAFLAPAATGSLLEWIAALKGQLERLRTPPPTSPDDTQLRSAWQSILEPRIGNMLSRLETWQDSSRWTTVEGEPDLIVLKDAQWAGFVQSMAMLATELHGAWKQYQNVKIKHKNLAADPPRYTSGPYVVRLAYPVSGLYQSILHRQAAARQLGFVRTGSHWHLLSRFRTAWDWSWDQSSTWHRYLEKKEAQAARERFEQALEVALEGTRDTLSTTLLGLQAFVAAVQESEQARLRGICLACRTDDATLREMAETALRDMDLVQLEAERYQGPSYSKYGSLLRSWYRRQRAAVSVLAITEKRLEEADAEPQAAPPPDATLTKPPPYGGTPPAR